MEARRLGAAKHGRVLDLPPPYRLVSLREVGDAFAHAQSIASESGAGTLVYVGRFDLAEFAVVLEPDEPLRLARRAFLAACTALGDAILAEAPPEKPVTFDWPDAVRVDGGLVGGARLAWPQGATDDEPPDWLVFGAMIRTVAMGDEEPGVRPLTATLEEEGFDDPGSDRMVESFARHLMSVLHTWHERGFAEVARLYMARLAMEKGASGEIAENGDLLIKRGTTAAERRSLVHALAAPSWFDAATGGPRR
ncbi:MAG: hypothetical protein FJX35_10065 [Alphaproteobacteria bacterium]|nr:hypothetical protein [Alphaproteobacteria bacterium]